MYYNGSTVHNQTLPTIVATNIGNVPKECLFSCQSCRVSMFKLMVMSVFIVEEDTLDDLPTDISAIIGSHPPTFHRHPSVSESGYSTPDSKALKRVIYEVIV